MNKQKVLVVDDETPARRKLIRQLSLVDTVECVGEAADGLQALQLIDELNPDLVLLDIQMPGMTGFDVVRLLETPKPHIIFVTAFDEYAVRAFEVAAIDYLLKPVSNERLQTALRKAAKLRVDPSSLFDVLDHPDYAKRLAVKFLKRVRLVNVEDVAYITSENRVVYVVDRTGNRHWTNETLDQLVRRLNPEVFFRIHRSSIINLAADFEIEPWQDGRLKIHFQDDHSLIVAREPATELRALLQF